MITEPVARRWRLPDRETWTVGIGVTLGLLSSGVGPWITGALVNTSRFDIQQASLMVTVEQITMGMVMLGLTGIVHRLPRRALLVVGVVLVLVSQAASYYLDGFVAMMASRTLSGMGYALIYSISMAIGASTRDPDRTFAAAQGMTQVGAMALNPLLGFGALLPGHKGVFIVIGAFSLLLAMPYLWLAFSHRPARALTLSATKLAAISLRSKRVIGVLGIITVYSVATGGAWNFMERVAASTGLSGPRLGTGLIISSLIGTLGSVLANRLGTSVGRRPPLCGGLILLGVATLWFMVPASAWQFWTVVSLWAFLFTFTTPYVFGLAAAADPTGRVVAATGTAFIIVSAVGVYFAALVVAHLGLPAFGLLAMLMLGGTAMLAALVSRAVDAAAQSTAPSAESAHS